MARQRNRDEEYTRPLRRLVLGFVVLVCLVVFVIWRIDNARMEQVRAGIIDAVLPNMSWAIKPFAAVRTGLSNLTNIASLHEQNQELRREIQRLKGWRETAVLLEQKYAKLLDLNNVQLNPKLSFVTAVVMADAGSPFRRSVIINVGSEDGILDGWATMDGLGVVGRISGVGAKTSRVLLLTDASSRIPAIVQPSGQRSILTGDNTNFPLLDLVEFPQDIQAGDRVVTSGDGGIFPSGLLVGQVVIGRSGRLRVQLAADYQRLEFLRVMRSLPPDPIEEPSQIVPNATQPGPNEASNG